MIAHSLSKAAHGRLPVAISKTQQPVDQMSTAPYLEVTDPVITSGDMYIGVPVILLTFVILRVTLLAITLAAPKSTNLMTPL
ncbi:hypothetical protein WICPIJ_003932 [Wickerhamomyces pijperi]|uniref:Uncharacterized protein n=1 Tax=Wickerhamomyces pijperi TaxID=599730 RepID=A0A9P8TMJ7_WICPI|nr:hypothetical protein WICPIJ_003932 [Wickerhamomyces pijperi]